MRRSLSRVCVAALALGLSTSTLAGEGRIPIWQPLTIGPGQEGNYVLTRDIVQVPGTPAIDILTGTGAVEIDLNGFTISGAGSGAADLIRAVGVSKLTVRNGTLKGTASGDAIDAYDCDDLVVEDIHAPGSGNHVAFDLDLVDHFTIRRNVTDSWGICMEVTDATLGAIEDNQVRNCDGVQAQASNLVVKGNRMRSIGPAIYVDTSGACLIADNVVGDATFGTADGIVSYGGICNVVNNVIKLESSGDGIVIGGSYGAVRNNAVYAAGNGLRVDGHSNQIEHNVFSYNSKAGIWLRGSNNTYGRNTLRSNLSYPGPCSSTPPACGPPDVCDDGTNNTSFGDNMGPGPGC